MRLYHKKGSAVAVADVPFIILGGEVEVDVPQGVTAPAERATEESEGSSANSSNEARGGGSISKKRVILSSAYSEAFKVERVKRMFQLSGYCPATRNALKSELL